MTKRGGRMTAAELVEMLNADPAFVARRDAAEAERDARAAVYRAAEAPLVADLWAAGYTVESAWDLVNTAESYPEAVPILLAHLPRPYPGPVREGIARALAVPEARSGWGLLTWMFVEETEERAKDGLAVAIAVIADDDVLDELIALARDSRHGTGRVLLLSALERSKDPRAQAALEALATDDDLKIEVAVIQRRRKRRPRR